MSALPSEILSSETAATVGASSHQVRLTLRVSSAEATVILQAASARQMSTTQFLLSAALAEAQRAVIDDRDFSTATDNRRLELINEAFDRLADALGESDKTVDVLVGLIRDAKNHTPR